MVDGQQSHLHVVRRVSLQIVAAYAPHFRGYVLVAAMSLPLRGGWAWALSHCTMPMCHLLHRSLC